MTWMTSCAHVTSDLLLRSGLVGIESQFRAPAPNITMLSDTSLHHSVLLFSTGTAADNVSITAVTHSVFSLQISKCHHDKPAGE